MNEPDYEALCEAAGPVSRETYNDLKQFEAMFRQWNGRINLAAPSTLSDLWRRHILDSAQVLPLKPEARLWLDVGSGGGFPGLVLAFLLRERRGGQIHLVESSRKKAGFLQAVVGRFGLPASIHAVRIEEAADLKELRAGVEVLTARALAPLPLLLDLCAPWLVGSTAGLFHKGRDYRAELQESVNRWRFDLIEHQSRTDPAGVILEIGALRRAQTNRQAAK